MAGVSGGYSNARVPLDYSFEVVVPNRKFMETRTFTHKGDVWQLQMVKRFHKQFTCKLQLVASLNAKVKLARICHFSNGELVNSSSTASFCHLGDKCDLGVDNGRIQKIVIEVLKNLEATEAPKLPPEHSMANEVLKWFQLETFGDVTIMAEDGQKFHCHRDILSLRSEVFGRMFSCPMKESRENLVSIDGYEDEIIAQLLVFLYIDDCGDIGPIANQLYVAAHHYEVERLKIICESAMTVNLSADSIVKTYRLATFYHLDKLMARCFDFLEFNKADLPVAKIVAEAVNVGEEPEAKRVKFDQGVE